MIELISNQLKKLKSLPKDQRTVYLKGESLYKSGSCQILTHAKNGWEVLVSDFEEELGVEVKIKIAEGEVSQLAKGKPVEWNGYGAAALMQIEEDLQHSALRIELPTL